MALDGSPRPEFRPAIRRRGRLSRTLSSSRGPEYRSLLRTAISQGYHMVSLERFLDQGRAGAAAPVMILRHDVDQYPAAVLEMAEVERELGLRSTWYFRWRTADAEVIERVREQGGEIGLHYETLTRRALTHGIDAHPVPDEVLAECRAELRDELESFRLLFGPVRSVAAHGDSRVPSVRNLEVLERVGPRSIGAEYDANISLRASRLGAWVTDRSTADGSWAGDGPFKLMEARCSPLLCLTHPNNWVSGLGLLRDRVLAAALPDRAAGRPARVRRALPDRPPRLDQLQVG